MINKSKLCISVCILTSIFGCQSTSRNVMVSESDPAMQQLVSLAKEISHYEQQLYEIESSRYIEANPEKIGAFDMYFLPAMDEYHNLGDNWTGPLTPLIEEIARQAGLNPTRYINYKPANDIIVHVDTRRRKLIDILADAGFQARQRAKVVLKMKERLIQVEYAPQ